MDLAIRPDGRLKLEHLRGWASRGRRGILQIVLPTRSGPEVRRGLFRPPAGSSSSVTSSWILPFAQMAGLNWSTCGAGQAGSGVAFSANPATVPCLLIWLAAPLLPPSVGSGVINGAANQINKQGT